MPVPCPGCGSMLDVTATSCGTCLRNRSRQEIFRGARLAKEQEDKIRTRPRRIAVKVLVAAALSGGAGFAWVHYPKQIQGLWKTAMERFAPSPSQPPPVRVPIPPSAPAAENPLAAAPAAFVAAPSIGSTSQEAPRKSASAVYDDSWTIKGRAYDLFSLKGVAKAEITFTDRSQEKKFQVRTDAKGAYLIKLPRKEEGGYEVAVRQKKYRSSYLDEMEPPYSSQSRSRRDEAVELLNVLHVPLLLSKNENNLDHNLILLPAEQEDQ